MSSKLKDFGKSPGGDQFHGSGMSHPFEWTPASKHLQAQLEELPKEIVDQRCLADAQRATQDQVHALILVPLLDMLAQLDVTLSLDDR